MEYLSMPRKLQNFADAFGDSTAGCVRTCECGQTFFDMNESDYDWDEGEFQGLMDGDAIGVDHSVGEISFQGRTFVLNCDCWHEKAEGLMKFLDFNARSIAEYLTLERQRKLAVAEAAPIVK